MCGVFSLTTCDFLSFLGNMFSAATIEVSKKPCLIGKISMAVLLGGVR